MKIFQSLQINYALVGIIPPHQNRKHRIFNRKNTIALLMYFQIFAQCCAFLLVEAKTFNEYAESFCLTTAMLTAGSNFAIIVWKSKKAFQLIKNYENLIGKRNIVERKKSKQNADKYFHFRTWKCKVKKIL